MRSLTFVIQGPNLDTDENKITSNLILSIRNFFPDSTIIFSTWENETIHKLPNLDKIVFNSDPGGILYHKELNILNNVNRQIVSTLNGLLGVETEYAIKVRSDLVFKSNVIVNNLKYLGLSGGDQNFKLLSNHVVVSNQTSVDPRKRLAYPFHLCDWIYCGKTQDLINIWDIPLMPEDWFQSFAPDDTFNNVGNSYLSRYLPESYIISSFVKKYMDISFQDSYDIKNNNIEISELIIANNFIVKSNFQLGIRSQKYNKKIRTLLPMYTYTSWKNLAKKKDIEGFEIQLDLLAIILPIINSFKFLFIFSGKLKKITKF